MDDVERLFRAYHQPLVRYLVRRLGDPDWAEELAQETFLRALRQPRLESERAWLFAVATNLVRDEARRTARRRVRLAELAAVSRDAVQVPEVEQAEADHEAQRQRAHRRARARAAIDALGERDREALLLREEGLDYDEIAAALGIARTSVGTTLSRARRRLTEHYEALERRSAGGRDDVAR
jgi:RNA polymerase sigma-70 factor (ECF subfamily)